MKKGLLIAGIVVIIGIVIFFIVNKPEEGEGGPFRFGIGEFLPFGRSDDFSPTEELRDDTSLDNFFENEPSEETIPKLRKISGEPVAGGVVFNVGTTTLVRFVEKGTGNVYEASGESTGVTRLTNTTIPKIIKAFWLPDGSGFLAQTLLPESEIIETSFVKLNKRVSASSEEILTPFSTTISKLPIGIRDIVVNKEGTKILYYTTNGKSEWFISNPDGTSSNLVISNPLTEWIPKWFSSDKILLQNKSSFNTNGYNYAFNLKNKTTTRVGFALPGMSSTINSSGSKYLVSSGGATPKLFFVDTEENILGELGAITLADKCVWLEKEADFAYCGVPNQLQNSNYPDSWYKGLISTEDSLEKVGIDGNTSYLVANLSVLSGEQIDMVDLDVSPDENHLIFRNKIDGYLWMFRILD